MGVEPSPYMHVELDQGMPQAVLACVGCDKVTKYTRLLFFTSSSPRSSPPTSSAAWPAANGGASIGNGGAAMAGACGPRLLT